MDERPIKTVFDYYMKVSGEKFQAIDRQFEGLHEKLDDHSKEINKQLQDINKENRTQFDELKRFKFTWTGALVAINAGITILLTIYFGKG